VDYAPTKETQELYALLQTLNDRNGAAFGSQYATFRGIYANGISWSYRGANNTYLASDIQNLCGIHPAFSGWDLNEFVMEPGPWYDANIQSIIRSSEMGVICTLSFHERNPVTGGKYNDTNITLSQVLPGGEYHKEFKAQWIMAADAISRMVRSDGTPVPILLRPLHENSGNWFWWGTKNSDADYIALWRWIVTYLRDTRGLHNILYVYNTDRISTKEQYLARWPGDDYVDIASCDVYMADDAAADVLTIPLGITIQVAEEKGIPAALAEVGSNATGGMRGTARTDWWTAKVLTPLREADLFRHIAWIAGWANWSPTQCYMPYPGEKNAANFISFLKSDEILLLDSLNANAVWTNHARLGWISTDRYPWVYSYNHGWIYMYNVFNPPNGDEWYYDFVLGWLWTGNSYYPYIWSSGKGVLYYIGTDTNGMRKFYCYDEMREIEVPLSQ
jgi:mannan endo-1,4-beta-mannosidase